MKLLRYGLAGRERPGMLDAQGRLRDLSGVIAHVTSEHLSDAALARLKKLDPASLPLVRGTPRLGVPYLGISKLVAIGLNYADHAAEAGLAAPSEPIVFLKATTCITGPRDDLVIPRGSTKTDWEVELGVVIGTKAQYVPEARALDHVAGYCVVNDVSERNFQLERGGQWDRGKGCDTFGPIGPWLATRDEVPDPQALDYVAGYCVVNDVSERAFQLQSSQWDKGKGCDTFGPIGPWLVTTDEIRDPQNLDMWLDVNGRRMQKGNTRTMIFGVAKLVSYCSQYMTLMPGDILTTGTPPGVGMGMKPEPVWLKPGDVMNLGIQGLGEQRQEVVAYPG